MTAKGNNRRVANKFQTFITLNQFLVSEEKVVQFLGGFFLRVCHDMGIQIHRNRDSRMTQTFRKYFWVFSLLKQKRSVSVTKIYESGQGAIFFFGSDQSTKFPG